MNSVLQLLDEVARAADCEVELSLRATTLGTTRFAESRVTQSGEVEDATVQARVFVDGRLGAARTNRVSREDLLAAIAHARQMATPAKFPGFDDGSAPTPEVPARWDEATASAGPDARAQRIAPAFAACEKAGLTAAGLCATSSTVTAVVTRAGCRREHRHTLARLDVIASGGEASARLGKASFAIGSLPAPELAERAVERALRTRDPIAIEPGAYDVVLEPACVAEALEWLALTSLGARTVEDASSCLAGREGERITGAVTLYDDAPAGEEDSPATPFDAEGTPCRRVTFLDGGVARGPVHDRATAARAAVSPTGHASPLDEDLFEGGPAPQHLCMTAGDATVEELVSRVERGLYVARFHYVNGLIDTRRAKMTGMTRDGLHLIENGRIGRAVKNLRWTESLLDAFARLDGISRARELLLGHLGGASFVVPSLLVRGWRFTS